MLVTQRSRGNIPCVSQDQGLANDRSQVISGPCLFLYGPSSKNDFYSLKRL